VVLRSLEGIESGGLKITDTYGQRAFGVGPGAEIEVSNLRFYTRLLTGGSAGAGASYADGDWDTSNLTSLLAVVLANQHVMDSLTRRWGALMRRGFDKFQMRAHANSPQGSRRNIAAHYDLSNEFFRMWLDDRMMYSSAVFADPEMTLEQASEHKLERLCDLLQLRDGDEVLEIGTGWGGLAEYVASHFDVHVTTTTISPAQFEEAQTRIASAGLTDRVTLLLKDYRELEGKFDRVVSVEMVEAVGNEFLNDYFKVVEQRLKPGGRFVMQAITIRDQRFHDALRQMDFIKKHIFPGAFIPSVSRLVQAASTTHSMRLHELHDIGHDYAQTLMHWSRRFQAQAEPLRKLGFDDRFQRLWHFYFSYCEAGFIEETISDAQMVFSTAPAPLRSLSA
jgi:cyclopropane-fatty-acyl-phospholipid synthase